MALVHIYNDVETRDSGIAKSGVEVDVRYQSNEDIIVPIFADAAGTALATPNLAVTDADGMFSFYIEPGEGYLLRLYWGGSIIKRVRDFIQFPPLGGTNGATQIGTSDGSSVQAKLDQAAVDLGVSVAGLQANINVETNSRIDADNFLVDEIDERARKDALLGDGGAATIGGISPSGATTILQRHIVRNYLEDIPGFVEGSGGDPDANTAALNAAIASGFVYNARPGALYKIGSSLIIPSNGGIVFEGVRKPTIFMPASKFTNTSLDAGLRYGTNAAAINCSGQQSGPFTPASNVRLENFIIQSETAQGRNLRGIVGQNCEDLQIGGVEVFGIPMGIGICVASVIGNSWIDDAYVHDFYDNTTGWGSMPQATGIEVDNDRINAIASASLRIRNAKIHSIVMGAAAITAYGYQTDGINIVHRTANRIQITGFDIDTVGEGIDTFGSYGLIANGVIKNAYVFGMKFIHGASYNQASNISIQSPGLAGLLFGTSADIDGDTAYNTVTGLTVSDVDPDDVWTANSTACVRVDLDAGQKAIGNTVVNATLVEGNAKYGWLDQSGSGNGNYGEDVRVVVGPNNDQAVYIQSGGGSVRLVEDSPLLTADASSTAAGKGAALIGVEGGGTVQDELDGLPVLASGTYTPTLAGVANVAASSAFACQYSRVGNIVTVSGLVSVTATLTATSTQLGISLPIASNFATANDANGSAASAGSTQCGRILSDAANDRVTLQFLSVNTGANGMGFTFSYAVL